jgi:hypothetical protein
MGLNLLRKAGSSYFDEQARTEADALAVHKSPAGDDSPPIRCSAQLSNEHQSRQNRLPL